MWKPADIGYSEVQNVPPQVTQEDIQGKALQDERQMQTVQRAAEAGVK